MARMSVTRGELLAYLDELLPAGRSSEIEAELRDSETLRGRAAELLAERDAGAHTLADIWRRRRLSCPGTDRLGEHLLGTLPPGWDRAVAIHLGEVGCRFCEAEVAALKAAKLESAADRDGRTRRIFESTVGLRP